MCKIVNIKQGKKYDIYIGRPSKFGNPYSHNQKSTANYIVDSIEDAVLLYEKYLLNNKELFDSLYELKYKILGCYCMNTDTYKGENLRCHGQILKKYVDLLEEQDTALF